ncbi:DNA methyltransferase [Robiginitalea sp. IMCC44478]|uniref:DNA methyltransferase n=1 Tax=Robiginitalea sp. IMCC44478 TaxID=3459122 RepID=UPI004041B3EF
MKNDRLKKIVFKNKSLSEDLPEKDVNIADKKRSNLFTWRGQFSPQLIETLIQNYAEDNSVLYDPFCGSGTLLIESARLNLSAYGTELNPAAYGLASIYKLTNSKQEQLKSALEYVENLILDYFLLEDLFNKSKGKELNNLKNELVQALKDSPNENTSIILNALIIGLDFEQKKLTHENLKKAWYALKGKIEKLPFTTKEINVKLGDARLSSLNSNSIDLVITSPPYINVFNYHQNYRKSVEATGFNVLDIAKSEIGANRKFRSNRYLTVIQYAMDIFQVFLDLKNICKPSSKIIFIVGRESSVRKTSFSNAKLLTEVANKAGFNLVGEQPRVFKNKFGQDIYEEILRFKLSKDENIGDLNSIKEIAASYLKSALKYAPKDSLADLNDAISKYHKVESSIIYNTP